MAARQDTSECVCGAAARAASGDPSLLEQQLTATARMQASLDAYGASRSLLHHQAPPSVCICRAADRGPRGPILKQESPHTLDQQLRATSRMQAIFQAYGVTHTNGANGAAAATTRGGGSAGGGGGGGTMSRSLVSSRPSSASSQASQQSIARLHNEKGNVCRVVVFLNGTLTNPVTVVARNIQQLLDQCTAKFAMTFAARRLFDRQGQELRNDVDLALLDRDAQVFVSAGEAFKDPIVETQQRLLRMEKAGKRPGYFPANASSTTTSTTGSAASSRAHSLRVERIQKLLAEARPRVLVFQGEDGRHGVEVVQGSMERFLDECTTRLRLAVPVKRVFTIMGEELTVLPSQLCDRALFWLLGRVIGPLWVTSGPVLSNLRGPRRFLKELRTRLVARRKAVGERMAQYRGSGDALADAASEVTRRLDHLLDIEKMTFYQLRAHQDQLHETLDFLDRTAHAVEAAEDALIEANDAEDEEANLKAAAKGRQFMGKGAVRLYVFVNGREPVPGSEKTVLFDGMALLRGMDNSSDAVNFVMERLLEMCSQAVKTTLRGRRLFLHNGIEVTPSLLPMVKRETQLWLSCGEPFIPPTQLVLDVRELTVMMNQQNGATSAAAAASTDAILGGAEVSAIVVGSAPPSAVSQEVVRQFLVGARVGTGRLLPTQRWTLVAHTTSALSSASVAASTSSASASRTSSSSSSGAASATSAPNISVALLVCEAFPGLAATVVPKGSYLPASDSSSTTSSAEDIFIALEPVKSPATAEQLWQFSSDGVIVSVLHPTLILSVPPSPPPPSARGRDEEYYFRDVMATPLDPDDMRVCLAARENISTRVGRRQRWGMRQDDFSSIGQWRLTVTAQPKRELSKDALLWPVLPSGTWNEDLHWPITAALVGEAFWEDPDLSNSSKPVFLRVLLNGMKDATKAVDVKVPPLPSFRSMGTTASSSTSSSSATTATSSAPATTAAATAAGATLLPLDATQWLTKRLETSTLTTASSSSASASALGTTTATLSSSSTATLARPSSADGFSPVAVQIQVFLDDCTRAMRLPRPAKHLFTSMGRTVTDLSKVKAGDVVYVSMGEAFQPTLAAKKRLRQVNQELEQLHNYHARAFVSGLVLSGDAEGEPVFLAAESTATSWVLTDARQIQVAGLDKALVLEAGSLAEGADVRLQEAVGSEVRQKWVMDADGFIQSAMDASLVLAVRDFGTVGSPLQIIKKSEIFNAHAKWRFSRQSDDTNVIHAYACDKLSLMVAAANRANICTIAVAGTDPCTQPAYVGGTASASTAILVCGSCARQLSSSGGSVGDGASGSSVLGSSSSPVGATSSSGLSPTCVGLKIFVCAVGEREAQEWRQADEGTRASLSARLGVRVDLSSKLSSENEIKNWTKESNRLQPNLSTGPPRAPTESLETKGQLRAVLFKNGVFEKAKSTTVLLPLGSVTSYVDKLLGEATARLRLPSAARALFTALGRQVTVLDTKQPDLRPDEDGQLPPLWVSCGEPWIDASKESELKVVKQQHHQLKKQLRALCDQLSVSVAGQMEAPVTDEERVLYDQLQAGRAELAALQKTIDKLVGRATLGEDSRLAQGPRAVRVRVRRNGTWSGPWQLCWGSTLQELLTSCSERMGFAVRKLYTSAGLPVVDVAELRMDQHIYVSAGEGFVETKALRQRIQARSDFAKALRGVQHHEKGCAAAASVGAAAGVDGHHGAACECGLVVTERDG